MTAPLTAAEWFDAGNCPDCHGTGSYTGYDKKGEPVQEQCDCVCDSRRRMDAFAAYRVREFAGDIKGIIDNPDEDLCNTFCAIVETIERALAGKEGGE